MAQKKLLTNGKAFKRTDDRWDGTVWHMDEKEELKRKSFLTFLSTHDIILVKIAAE